LRDKVKEDTILVSIVAVNSELGIRQPLKTLRQIIKKQNENTVLHSDMTQAVGKVNVNLHDVDMASITAHKIYGPKGIGMLYKSEKVNIEPIIHGSSDSLRSGTPSLPLIVAFSKALRLAVTNQSKNESVVRLLNDKLTSTIAKYPKIVMNKTGYSIPHIFNISLMNIRPETMIHALEKRDIYVGSNTACSKGSISTAILALYGDEVRAKTSIRICLSHLTSFDDINKFLYSFDIVYNKLLELGDENE
jgi:cysteine desulfurase